VINDVNLISIKDDQIVKYRELNGVPNGLAFRLKQERGDGFTYFEYSPNDGATPVLVASLSIQGNELKKMFGGFKDTKNGFEVSTDSAQMLEGDVASLTRVRLLIDRVSNRYQAGFGEELDTFTIESQLDRFEAKNASAASEV